METVSPSPYIPHGAGPYVVQAPIINVIGYILVAVAIFSVGMYLIRKFKSIWLKDTPTAIFGDDVTVRDMTIFMLGFMSFFWGFLILLLKVFWDFFLIPVLAIVLIIVLSIVFGKKAEQKAASESFEEEALSEIDALTKEGD